ncbi:hypothetical protein TSUD_245730 [Trifolium subterraneum]|uniref:CASP-like protein n=1 Tax=Trifolium subterraneum TaxID=3900 RepID=A0A2Z6NXP5_TRISU|nr:hypothetical protein TSUD_245730 [Trifolium subterraneum]
MATPKPAMKKSWSRGSDSTQFESPARFCSPLRWDTADSPEYRSPENSPGKMVDNSLAVVTVDKPKKLSHDKLPQQQKPPENAVMVVNRPERDQEPQRQMTKVVTTDVEGERRPRSASSVGRTAEEVTIKAALGFRLCEVVVCLISFSVMAANKTQGWSGDSYDRYKEYRYCLSVNVVGFAYSALQAFDLAYQLVSEKHMISHHLRYHFQFIMDQASCGISSDISIILCSHTGGRLAIELGERRVHRDGYCFGWNVFPSFFCFCYELTNLWLHPLYPPQLRVNFFSFFSVVTKCIPEIVAAGLFFTLPIDFGGMSVDLADDVSCMVMAWMLIWTMGNVSSSSSLPLLLCL